MTRTASDWIVLKFGGTSVSSLANWRNIAKVTRARLDDGARVLIVHSAITGITDRLEKLLDSALAQTHEADLRAIEERQHAIAEQQRSLRGRWGEGSNADTENLRATLRMYKTFLDQLIGPRA